MNSRTMRRFQGYLFISPWLIGLVGLTLGPMLLSLYYSFNEYDLFQPAKFIGLGNYNTMFFNDRLFWISMRNTAIYTMGRVPIVMGSSLVVALLLNQPIPFRNFLRTAYYLPSVVPAVAMYIIWVWLFEPQVGLVNYFLSLLGISGPLWLGSIKWAMPALIGMSIWGIGGTMVIFLAGLQGVPEHLYEAAELDGASAMQRLLHITLPMVSSVVFFNLIMTIIHSFQVFGQAYVMTSGGPAYATLTIVLYIYEQAFNWFRMGYGSGLAWVLFAVLSAFTAFIFRSSTPWVYYESGGRA